MKIIMINHLDFILRIKAKLDFKNNYKNPDIIPK